jgi:hypothetical protein
LRTVEVFLQNDGDGRMARPLAQCKAMLARAALASNSSDPHPRSIAAAAPRTLSATLAALAGGPLASVLAAPGGNWSLSGSPCPWRSLDLIYSRASEQVLEKPHNQLVIFSVLAVNTYSQDYLNACRQAVDAPITAYKALRPNSAFEQLFFNNLVVVLDRIFVHRARGREGKNGNPFNEVRMLATPF